MDLIEVAQELYGLAPGEFTDARNERAKQLRAADRGLSAAVGALPKPATAAWVLNMLVRHEAALVDQVVELGASLRAAQESLAGEQLRELNRQRRQLTAAVTTQARELARRLGVRVTDAVADQVKESLRAAMTDAAAAVALRTGLLVKPLSATGLGELDVSSLVAVPSVPSPASADTTASSASPSLSVVGGKKAGARGKAARDKAAREKAAEKEQEAARRRAVKEAEAAAKQAEKDEATARKELDQTSGRVAELEARSLQVQSELEEVRRRAAELEHALESVEDELSEVEDDRDSAQHELTRAEHIHAEAVAALDRARDRTT